MSKDLIKENSATKKVLARTVLASVFVLFVLIGIFSPMVRVHAEECQGQNADGTLFPAGCTNTTTTTTTTNNSDFENYIEKQTCGFVRGSLYPGCFLQISYAIFYSIPAFLLTQVAFFFNILISVTLSSDLLKNDFVGKAWSVVRDLSNIFFILILLYIAIKLILGIGGSEVKKMIGSVIIMALLINFSMFFTQVIIDSSNILALIFYNKVSVDTTVAGQTTTRPYTSAAGEKDVAGGMVSAFDPTRAVSQPFIDQARTRYDQNGQSLPGIPDNEPPVATLVAIMIITALIMGIAIYALIVSGLSFLGRLIELWILIIFSPFAFMSYTVPKFASVTYLGWDAWFKRLLKVAFMAPIFMFFLYFIFMLIKANLFSGFITLNSGTDGPSGIIKMLLGIILPAIFICVLLLKATKYAKEGSGAIGEVVMKGAKIAGGLALGAGLGATAMAGRNIIGGGGGYLANKAASGMNKFGSKLEDKYGRSFGVNKVASGLTSVGAHAQKGSFDVRGVKIAGKDLAGATSMKLGEAKKGGITQARKEKVEKRMKRADMLKVREDEGLKQKLNKTETDLQDLLNENAHVIDTFDKIIEKKRQEANDANTKLNAARGTPGEVAAKATASVANGELDFAKQNKKDFRDGNDYMVTNSAGVTSIEKGTGKNIEVLEKRKREAAQDIKNENRRRTTAFANRKGSWGKYSSTANKEARHQIIMESKIESK